MQLDSNQPMLRPLHRIDGIEEFGPFLAALADALPRGATLAIISPGPEIATEFRKLGAEEVKSKSGWWSNRGFLLPLTPASIDRLCQLHAQAMPEPVLGMGFEAWSGDEPLMSWHDWWEDPPYFSARIGIDQLRAIAARCGGEVSSEIP